MGNSDYHITLPLMVAFRFVEAYVGPQHTLDVFRACATGALKINGSPVLNRHFLSWRPWNKSLTQCAFKPSQPLPELSLEFNENVTSNIYKVIDGDKAAMVIYIDSESDDDLRFYAESYLGITGVTLEPNDTNDTDVFKCYHNYVTPVMDSVVSTSVVFPKDSIANHLALSGIIRDLI